MSSNIILKFLLNNISEKTNRDQYDESVSKPIKNLSTFELVNIVGRNRLFMFGIVLFIAFAFFLRTNITIGVLFGFIFLSAIYYIYYNYLVYDIEKFTKDKEEKINFLNTILNKGNDTLSDSLLSDSDNWVEFGEENKSYLYINPVVVDFYYKNKYLLEYSYNSFAKSLMHMNSMIKLEKQIEMGLENRGNQYSLLKMIESKCLNAFQACIYALPSSTAMNEAYKNNIKFLQRITQNIIEKAKKKIEEQNSKQGIDTEYYPIYSGGASANDVGTYGYNDHYNFFR